MSDQLSMFKLHLLLLIAVFGVGCGRNAEYLPPAPSSASKKIPENVLQLTSIATGETITFRVKESHYNFNTETLSFHVDEDTKLKMGTRFLKQEMQMRYNDFDCGKATVFGELGTHIGIPMDEAVAAKLPPEVNRIGTPRNKGKSLDALDQFIDDNRKELEKIKR